MQVTAIDGWSRYIILHDDTDTSEPAVGYGGNQIVTAQAMIGTSDHLDTEGTSGVDLVCIVTLMTVGVDSGSKACNDSVNGQPNHLDWGASIP
jgi:hypothetical protein